MATTTIHDACEAGALAGLLASRSYTSILLADYVALVAEAKAIADEFIVVNAAAAVPIADGTPANIGPVVQSVAEGVLTGRYPNGTVAADFLKVAGIIYAVAAQAKATGGLT